MPRPVSLLALALMATACTSTVGGSGSGPASSPVTSSERTSPAGVAPTRPAPARPPTAAALAELLRRGARGARSAHVNVLSGGLSGVADERLAAGTVTAIHLRQQLGAGQQYEVLSIATRAWARLPAFYTGTGAWFVVSPQSSLGPIRSIAAGLPGVRSTASPLTAGVLAGAASTVRALGALAVGGVPTQRYELVVRTQALPAGLPLRQQLAAAGLARVPVEVDVDADGRPMRLVADGSTVTWTRYDRPVRITAPRPSQITVR